MRRQILNLLEQLIRPPIQVVAIRGQTRIHLEQPLELARSTALLAQHILYGELLLVPIQTKLPQQAMLIQGQHGQEELPFIIKLE
jgi:hypothetical protein